MDWERLEAEFADLPVADVAPSLADRIVARARRHAAQRAALAAALAFLMAAVLLTLAFLVVLHREPTDVYPRGRPPLAQAQPNANTQAQIYAAALSGAARPRRLPRPMWVDSRVCAAVPLTLPTRSRTTCADGVIPATVRREVVAVLGARLRFALQPPVPRGPGDPPVVQFGRMVVRGDRARLGVETRCGPVCGEGETLLLGRQDGRWQVLRSVGPRWVS